MFDDFSDFLRQTKSLVLYGESITIFPHFSASLFLSLGLFLDLNN